MKAVAVKSNQQIGNKAIANSVSQKKKNGYSSFWFVDNRAATFSQAGLQLMIDNSSRIVAQRERLKKLTRMSGSAKPDVTQNTGNCIIQRMSIANGRAAVNTVRTQVPKAANRVWDVLTTLGKSIDRSRLCDDILNWSLLPFGTNDLAYIVPRAGIAAITRGAVCDNYQEMIIAEIARSGFATANDTVHGEHYPGHSYVSVSDNTGGVVNHDNDLIVDAWRKMVDRRLNFRFFSKYRKPDQYVQHEAVPTGGAYDWLNDPIAQYDVDAYLNNLGFSDPDRQTNIEDYMRAYPGHRGLTEVYLI